MSDYTPTTAEIALATVPGSYLSWGDGYFQRWLSKHDREVAALAWDEAAAWTREEGMTSDRDVQVMRGDNPYREEAR